MRTDLSPTSSSIEPASRPDIAAVTLAKVFQQNRPFRYAGIGSRKTPRARDFDAVVRSGGAFGADIAFESGAGDRLEIPGTICLRSQL